MNELTRMQRLADMRARHIEDWRKVCDDSAKSYGALLDACYAEIERLRDERNRWERRARELESLCEDRL